MRKKIQKRIAMFMCMAVAMSIMIHVGGPEAKAKMNVNVSAESAVVMDVQSGSILLSKNMNKREYPASITKVLTALVAIENSSLSETVTFSETALQLESGASNIGLRVGEKLTMEECLYGILLMSANEACNGAAEHIAGSIKNFVKMMNKRAKELGCTGTHFANTNGLWMKNHYTTAHDMALIAQAAFKNPTFAKITGTKRYKIQKTNKHKDGIYLFNHHGMLLAGNYPQYVYEYCVGGKTGFTVKCRYTLVTFAKKKGMTLLSVIMRAPNHPSMEPNEYTDTTRLLNYCFEHYSRYNIQDKAVGEINNKYLFNRFSPFYNYNTSELSIDSDAGVVLPKGVRLNQAEKKVEYYDNPQSDSNGRKVIGKITYTYKGKEVGGSDIFYKKSSVPTLKDSIDMSKWFDDAVEMANEEPFPWKKVIFFILSALVVAAAALFVIWRIRTQKEKRTRKNRYKKNRKKNNSNGRGIYFRRKR